VVRRAQTIVPALRLLAARGPPRDASAATTMVGSVGVTERRSSTLEAEKCAQVGWLWGTCATEVLCWGTGSDRTTLAERVRRRKATDVELTKNGVGPRKLVVYAATLPVPHSLPLTFGPANSAIVSRK
jgi:hypothetical protein